MQGEKCKNPILSHTKCRSENDLLMLLCCTEFTTHLHPGIRQNVILASLHNWIGFFHGQILIETATHSLCPLSGVVQIFIDLIRRKHFKMHMQYFFRGLGWQGGLVPWLWLDGCILQTQGDSDVDSSADELEKPDITQPYTKKPVVKAGYCTKQGFTVSLFSRVASQNRGCKQFPRYALKTTLGTT